MAVTDRENTEQDVCDSIASTTPGLKTTVGATPNNESSRSYDCEYCKSYSVSTKLILPHHIHDSEVPSEYVKGQDPNYCKKTLPKGLIIKKSDIPGAGLGVFAAVEFPKGTVFGPYKGKIQNEEPLENVESDFLWQITRNFRHSHYIDASDPTGSNWCRFINCSRSENERCLTAFQHKWEIYFRAHQHIGAGTEFLVHYGNDYAQYLGIRELDRWERPQSIIKKSSCRAVADSHNTSMSSVDGSNKSMDETESCSSSINECDNISNADTICDNYRADSWISHSGYTDDSNAGYTNCSSNHGRYWDDSSCSNLNDRCGSENKECSEENCDSNECTGDSCISSEFRINSSGMCDRNRKIGFISDTKSRGKSCFRDDNDCSMISNSEVIDKDPTFSSNVCDLKQNESSKKRHPHIHRTTQGAVELDKVAFRSVGKKRYHSKCTELHCAQKPDLQKDKCITMKKFCSKSSELQDTADHILKKIRSSSEKRGLGEDVGGHFEFLGTRKLNRIQNIKSDDQNIKSDDHVLVNKDKKTHQKALGLSQDERRDREHPTESNRGSDPDTLADQQNKLYRCCECETEFSRRWNLERHLKMHLFGKKMKFQCGWCGLKMSSVPGLQNHEKTHRENDRCFCCILRHSSGSRLYKCQKSYSCDVCGCKFRSKSGVSQHKRIHTGEKPFKCGICDQLFRYKFNYKTHKRTHTGERPYVCKTCDRGFTQSNNLKRHQQRTLHYS